MASNITQNLVLLLRFGLLCWFLGTITPHTGDAQPDIDPCVAIVGDSIPFGTFVVEVPGFGFPVVQGESFSLVFDTYLNEQDVAHISIHDLSVPATSLNAEAATYFGGTPQALYLRANPCRYIVFFPWINDLPSATTANPGAQYVANLQGLQATLPADVHSIILNFYTFPVTDLGTRIYGTSIQPDVVTAINQRLAQACADEQFAPNTSCLDLNTPMQPIDSYVVSTLTRDEFYAGDYRPGQEADWSMFDQYWTADPTAIISADSIHLNAEGKYRVATLLYEHITMLDPRFFVWSFDP